MKDTKTICVIGDSIYPIICMELIRTTQDIVLKELKILLDENEETEMVTYKIRKKYEASETNTTVVRLRDQSRDSPKIYPGLNEALEVVLFPFKRNIDAIKQLFLRYDCNFYLYVEVVLDESPFTPALLIDGENLKILNYLNCSSFGIDLFKQ